MIISLKLGHFLTIKSDIKKGQKVSKSGFFGVPRVFKKGQKSLLSRSRLFKEEKNAIFDPFFVKKWLFWGFYFFWKNLEKTWFFLKKVDFTFFMGRQVITYFWLKRGYPKWGQKVVKKVAFCDPCDHFLEGSLKSCDFADTLNYAKSLFKIQNVKMGFSGGPPRATIYYINQKFKFYQFWQILEIFVNFFQNWQKLKSFLLSCGAGHFTFWHVLEIYGFN